MGLFGTSKKRKGRGRAEPRLFADTSRSDVTDRRSPKRRRSLSWRFIKFFFTLGFWGVVAGALAFSYIWFTLDARGLLRIPEREPGIMMLSANGSVLAEQGAFFGDAARIAELPDYVPNAIIAIEDHRFRSHYGVDPIGLVRAVSRNILAGHLVQGGSTLTQQLAKNLFLTPEKTITRKAQEAVLAIWLESKFTKDEILQLYLNRVYFAPNAIGIEQASHVFFNKSALELSINEAATLAGMLKAPTTYNPALHPDAAAARAKLVVDAMVRESFVSAEDAQASRDAPSNVVSANYIPAKHYAVDWIEEQLPLLVKNYDQSIVVETTIDPAIQSNAEKSLRKRLSESAKKLNVSEGAIVVLDTTGAVTAMVGGRSYKKSQYNRATKARRQPGSAFKPFVYLAAFQDGYRPDSIEVDEPISIGGWTPANYKQKYQGAVTLETAFAQSINTVAAKLAYAVGPENVAITAERLGIMSPLGHDASIALGTSEVTPLELTSAFVPFANGGRSVQPYVVRRITTKDGKVLYEHGGDGLGQVITDRNLGEMNRLLRAVVRYGTGTKAQFGDFDIGGKTGTSQDYRDAWFIGFTPYMVTGVWMGNDDNTPTKNVTGGSLPAQVWRDVMEPAHQGLIPAVLPGTVEVEPSEQVAVLDPQLTENAVPPAQEPAEITVPAPKKKKRYLFDFLFGKN